MKSEKLRLFIQHLKELPTLPAVALRLLEVSTDNEAGLQEAAKIIQSDASLSAKLLRLANSASFGLSREVTDIERAASLLGMEVVRSMALSLLIIDVFDTERGRAFSVQEFWHHNVACAIASELMAERLHYPKPKEAFIAGLLHDLGKIILFHWNRDEYDRAVAEARKGVRSLLETEEQCFEFGHTLAAKVVMEEWRFPAQYVAAAWLHHQPLKDFASASFQQLPFIVKCANALCHVQRFGNSGNAVGDLDLEELKRVTGCSESELQHMSADVLRRFREVTQLFNWQGTTLDLYLSALSRVNTQLSALQTEVLLARRREALQDAVGKATHQLLELLTCPPVRRRALERIVEILAQSFSPEKVMLFAMLREEKVMEGCVKRGPSGAVRHLVLPFPEPISPATKSWKQIALLEQAALGIGDPSEVGREVVLTLHNPNLLHLPLRIDQAIRGHLFVEPAKDQPVDAKITEALKQYGETAALVLKHIRFLEELNEQAEQIARSARKAEKEQTRRFQEQRLASVGRLAAGAAHEINNPLTIILGHARLLLERARSDEERRSLQAIADQSLRISKIVQDLMGLSRPVVPQREPTDIPALLEQTRQILEEQLKAAGVVVKIDSPENLPSLPIDPLQMEQVFLNLYLNALQAMESSGGELTVSVDVEEDSGWMRISFTDTGEGIEPRTLPAIFDPFFTTREVGKGTGLGLAICHSIVEAHAGEIRFSSRKGEGSTFLIRLPLRPPPSPSLGLAPSYLEPPVNGQSTPS